MFIIMGIIIICVLALVISAFTGNWIYDLVCKILKVFKEEEVKVEEQKEDVNVKEI